MLSFKKEIFLVKGKAKACIYDFNQNKLYHLERHEVEFVDSILGKEIHQLHLNGEEKAQLEFLLTESIIQDSPEFNSGDITIMAQKPQIDFVWIEVTEQCNLQCIHCYDESCIEQTKKISLDDFKHTIDELLEIDVRKIQLIGGEPLILGKELREMVRYCLGKMDFIEIFTNGTLITEEWCQFFQKNNIHIAVSVYSYDGKMHDRVTKNEGSHERTVKGLELLKKYNIKYRVANVLLKDIVIGERNTELYELSHQRDVVRLTGRANVALLTPELIKKRLITEKNFFQPFSQ